LSQKGQSGYSKSCHIRLDESVNTDNKGGAMIAQEYLLRLMKNTIRVALVNGNQGDPTAIP